MPVVVIVVVAIVAYVIGAYVGHAVHSPRHPSEPVVSRVVPCPEEDACTLTYDRGDDGVGAWHVGQPYAD